MLILSRKFR